MQSLFSPSSPAHYYLPGVPITVASTLGALLAGWDTRGDRLPLGAAAVGTISAGAVTVYVVRALNVKLCSLPATRSRPPSGTGYCAPGTG